MPGEDIRTMFSEKEQRKAEKLFQERELAKKKGEEIPLGSNIPLDVREVDFIDYRDEIWGDSYNWSWNRLLTQVEYLAIHHSAGTHEATPDDIALIHKNNGWNGIGYHLIITKDGRVWYVGDIGTARANVADMNEKVIGICLVGDFTKHLPSDAQIISAHKVCNFFTNYYLALTKIQSWNNVVGHKDLKNTACPGSSWGANVPDHMKWRIESGTPYSPPLIEDTLYRVTHKKEVIWIEDFNPIEKIGTLENKLKKYETGKVLIANGEFLNYLIEIYKKNDIK